MRHYYRRGRGSNSPSAKSKEMKIEKSRYRQTYWFSPLVIVLAMGRPEIAVQSLSAKGKRSNRRRKHNKRARKARANRRRNALVSTQRPCKFHTGGKLRRGKGEIYRRGWSRMLLKAAHDAYWLSYGAMKWWNPEHPVWNASDARNGALNAWKTLHVEEQRKALLARIKAAEEAAIQAVGDVASKADRPVTYVVAGTLAVGMVNPVMGFAGAYALSGGPFLGPLARDERVSDAEFNRKLRAYWTGMLRHRSDKS